MAGLEPAIKRTDEKGASRATAGVISIVMTGTSGRTRNERAKQLFD